MFEFEIPWDDDADTITDMSFLNGEILDEVFVGIQNGHFVYNGERIRFLEPIFAMALVSHPMITQRSLPDDWQN